MDEGEESHWKELPSDLIHLISRKLHDIFNYMYFRVGCKVWYAATASDPPAQFPLLLEGKALTSDKFKFYSFYNDKTYTVQVPESQNKTYFGQSNGFLITFRTGEKNTSPTILNPLTRAQVPLPFIDCNFFSPVFICKNPIQNAEDMVIQMQHPKEGHCVGFWDKENNKWGSKQMSPGSTKAFHNGMFFSFDDRTGITKAIELATKHKLLEIGLPNGVLGFYCLVEVDGGLVGIVQHSLLSGERVPLERCFFEVYRLEGEKIPPRWVKMSAIGDNIIFLNIRDGFCISSCNFKQIRGNYIYFQRWNGKYGDARRALIGRSKVGEECSEMLGSRPSKGTCERARALICQT